MRIMHIFSINSGGAAVAAKRIAAAVEQISGEQAKSSFLALYAAEQDTQVTPYVTGKAGMFLVRAARKAAEILQEPKLQPYPGPFHLGQFGVGGRIGKFLKDVDVIHIHWVNRGFLSLKQLDQLTKLGKPIVWTMHDMWAFTGGCHYDGECKQYETQCKNCICIASHKKDVSAEQKQKKQIFQKKCWHFVGCSQWMAESARNSYIMEQQNQICCIPNPIDTTFFAPLSEEERLAVRNEYGISETKKIILFGAVSSDDKRKGSELVHQIFEKLPVDQYQLVIFGGCENRGDYAKYDTVFLNYIRDPQIMRKVYAMADVFIAPSIQENLANTVMESLSCGTPVVAFDIGGMKDMILPGENGFLVEPFSIEGYAKAVGSVSDDMRSRARESVCRRFSPETVGEQYLALYQKAMEQMN